MVDYVGTAGADLWTGTDTLDFAQGLGGDDHGSVRCPRCRTRRLAVCRGERRPDGRRKTIAYAVGCNPDADPFDDWWELARAEFGGDDFGEFFDLHDGVFARLLHSEDDLEVSATATHLSLQVVPPAQSGH